MIKPLMISIDERVRLTLIDEFESRASEEYQTLRTLTIFENKEYHEKLYNFYKTQADNLRQRK